MCLRFLPAVRVMLEAVASRTEIRGSGFAFAERGESQGGPRRAKEGDPRAEQGERCRLRDDGEGVLAQELLSVTRLCRWAIDDPKGDEIIRSVGLRHTGKDERRSRDHLAGGQYVSSASINGRDTGTNGIQGILPEVIVSCDVSEKTQISGCVLIPRIRGELQLVLCFKAEVKLRRC